MADVLLADQIRTFAYDTYVAPNLSTGDPVRIRAGDVHKSMGFRDRVPAVCEALRARVFQEKFGLRLLDVEGRPVSTTTTFVFATRGGGVAAAGTLALLTDPDAVLQAIAEFRALGRRAFLKKHGFGPAQRYFLVHQGEHFDSKAIAGVAHGKQFPAFGPLTSGDFSGGESTVRSKLQSLGFTVADLAAGLPKSPLEFEGAAWAEVSSFEHGHGGPDWEFGKWLWSPTTSKDGAERYRVMLQPKPGDQVFHLMSGVEGADPKRRFLVGVSRVASAAVQTDKRPSLLGAWGAADAFYRIGLSGFQDTTTPVPMDEVERALFDVVLADLADRPKYYPYSPYGDGFRGSQGIYLTRLTPSLSGAFRELCGATPLPGKDEVGTTATAIAEEYAEGERGRREASFFKRNPALRNAAIAKHGLRCVVCRLDFSERYGDLGKGYIEIHHKDPLSERLDTLSGRPALTTVDDVAPLCANCHRMAHRRRPALTLEELLSAFSKR